MNLWIDSNSYLLSELEKDVGRKYLDHQDENSFKNEEKEISLFVKGSQAGKERIWGIVCLPPSPPA